MGEVLTPVYDRAYFHKSVQEHLEKYWWENLFKPLYAIMREDLGVRMNSKSYLLTALRQGRVQYNDGFFSGSFTSGISRDLKSLGASWNKNRKGFQIEPVDLPMDVKAAASYSKQKLGMVSDKLLRKIDEVADADQPILDFTSHFEKVVKDLNQQFKSTVKPHMAVPHGLSPEQREALSKAYSKNLNEYVAEYTREEAQRLRDKITKTVLEGYRSDKLAKQLKAEFGVTSRKAKFLARQETSLLVSKYRQVRYQELGLDEYRWSTSHDERVREDHKILDYQYRLSQGLKPLTFSYSNPPITDRATGARNNPGEDFNCRCVARPVVKF